MKSFFGELRRRNVFKIAITYAIVAWVIAQIYSVIDVPLALPRWFETMVIVLLALGFPVALVLAWAYELTPSGIQRTPDLPAEESPPVESTPIRPRYGLIAMLAVVVLALLAGGVLLVMQYHVPAGRGVVEYTQLTNFTDSAVAPSLSPDGRELAFIRGGQTFLGPGEVYVKMLPDGEPVQLTHDGSTKMGPTVFSPDGSRIAYSVGIDQTWTIPVLGGEPSRFLPNGGAMTWAGKDHVLFSKMLGTGLLMGIFTSAENRSNERKVYVPADVNGMAHRSALSPDGSSVLVVEMDLGGWLPCRLVPVDGSTQGRVVGPAPAQCTDVAWSPDGKWMYFSANAGNGYHIWRQGFPDGAVEQVTSGATEEQGIAFAADGKSFVTSIGDSHSVLWVHDGRGDRQVTSQGYAYMPAFSADGKALYYLQRSRANRRFVSGELWVTDIDTGKREHLLPDLLMEHYDVAPDSRRVLCVTIGKEGRSEIWMATVDNSAPPRRLGTYDTVLRALFDPAGGIFFDGGKRGSEFLYHMQEDGGEVHKVLPQPITFLYSVSPGGSEVAVWDSGDIGWAHSRQDVSSLTHGPVGVNSGDVAIYSRDGSTRTVVCRNCGSAGGELRGIIPPAVSWSHDGKFLYVFGGKSALTYAVPIENGRSLPVLPPGGLSSRQAVDQLPGVRAFPESSTFPGLNSTVYAFPRLTTVRNIYRIPVT